MEEESGFAPPLAGGEFVTKVLTAKTKKRLNPVIFSLRQWIGRLCVSPCSIKHEATESGAVPHVLPPGNERETVHHDESVVCRYFNAVATPTQQIRV
jgi:hypothetical protein